MTRSLACKLLCTLAHDLSDAELQLMKDSDDVACCYQIRCVMQEPLPPTDVFASSVRAKFIVSESTRPDIIELCSGLQANFSLQGITYQEGISDFIARFNTRSPTESARLSEWESKMLHMLPHQEPLSVVSWSSQVGPVQEGRVRPADANPP